MKSVCFFGTYDPQYARNKVLMNGFNELGWEVIECRVNHRVHTGMQKYWELFKEYRRIRHHECTLVLVCFPGQHLVWLARLLFRKPIIFDAFVSLYDSYVYDRKFYTNKNPRAWKSWLLDYISVRLATVVLLDTEQHIKYFVRTFHASVSKFVRVFIGADESLMYPRDIPLTDQFTVEFHGSFIPLQGITYILSAAELLKEEEIRFEIIGDGQEYEAMHKKAEALGLTNTTFVGRVPSEEIPLRIASAHLCLGIFGDTNKTQRVIPNKVYECMAMGKPVITADTPAIRELAPVGKIPLSLVPTADAEGIAQTIRVLASDRRSADELGRAARAFFVEHLQAKDLVQKMLRELPSSALRHQASPL